jgi:hypothetical protein
VAPVVDMQEIPLMCMLLHLQIPTKVVVAVVQVVML